jgi:hypothetical protein
MTGARCAWSLFAFLLLFLASCDRSPEPGTVLDEASLANRSTASLAPANEPYFQDMDGGIPLTPEQAQGRDIWLLWTGGNDRLWDSLSRY